MRASGISYRDLENEGIGLVVVEAHLIYKRAARFDDELGLRTRLSGLSKASLRFDYTLVRDGEVLATGYTRHGCVELTSGRPSRLPGDLAARLQGAEPRADPRPDVGFGDWD